MPSSGLILVAKSYRAYFDLQLQLQTGSLATACLRAFLRSHALAAASLEPLEPAHQKRQGSLLRVPCATLDSNGSSAELPTCCRPHAATPLAEEYVTMCHGWLSSQRASVSWWLCRTQASQQATDRRPCRGLLPTFQALAEVRARVHVWRNGQLDHASVSPCGKVACTRTLLHQRSLIM